VYQLMVEPGTRLKERIRSKAIAAPNDDMQAKQMDAAITFLYEHNFIRYEISNFAQKGFECRHNLLYWTNRPYLGLGVAAHGFTSKRRFYHPRSLEKYMLGLPALEDKEIQTHDPLINLLRLKRPIAIARIVSIVDDPVTAQRVLDEAIQKKWFNVSKGILTLTDEGLKFSDSLLSQLW
ncbi:MAG TPA: hypothetical protein PLY93_06975, partial [Turneriella sp.]|nr:hypothetical protein [Turneriella sp.]